MQTDMSRRGFLRMTGSAAIALAVPAGKAGQVMKAVAAGGGGAVLTAMMSNKSHINAVMIAAVGRSSSQSETYEGGLHRVTNILAGGSEEFAPHEIGKIIPVLNPDASPTADLGMSVIEKIGTKTSFTHYEPDKVIDHLLGKSIKKAPINTRNIPRLRTYKQDSLMA